MWTEEARANHAPRNDRYPSDMTDAEWAIITEGFLLRRLHFAPPGRNAAYRRLPSRLLSTAGLGALVVNLGCALPLARSRRHSGSRMPAAFLSAPNDALAIVATIGAGQITLHVLSGWPDLGPDLGLGSADLHGALMHGIEPQPAGCLPAHPGPCRLPDLI